MCRREELGDAHERRAPCADRAVRPRLRGDPLHDFRVVVLLGFAEPFPLSFGQAGAAHVHAHVDVAVADQVVVERGDDREALVVAGLREDHGQRSCGGLAILVGRQRHRGRERDAVAHRDALAGDLRGAGIVEIPLVGMPLAAARQEQHRSRSCDRCALETHGIPRVGAEGEREHSTGLGPRGRQTKAHL